MTLLLVWQFAQFSTVSDGETGKAVVWFGYLQDVMFLIVLQCTVARVVNGHFDLAKDRTNRLNCCEIRKRPVEKYL